MHALIQKSDSAILRVQQFDEPPTLADSKPFYWRECPGNCTPAWTLAGSTFSPPPEPQAADDYTDRSPEYVIADATWRAQDRLDQFAQTRNYDGILSAATYATSVVPQFAAEGQYAVSARDMTWITLYSIMAAVQGGTRPMPASYAEVEAELPVLEWPE